MKVFLDSADPEEIAKHHDEVDGFTTNPTLMRRAGITDYLAFAKALVTVTDKPVSLEVLADSVDGIEREADILAGLGDNVFVKIPVTLSSGEPLVETHARLAGLGVRVNATAVTTLPQVEQVADAAEIVSLFCGRIADAGVDPTFVTERAVRCLRGRAELLWASAREAFNVCQAEACGADIITLTGPLLAKTRGFGTALGDVSLATVRQFVTDGEGFTL